MSDEGRVGFRSEFVSFVTSIEGAAHETVSVTGSVFEQPDKRNETLTVGTPILYPRRGSVIKSSSTDMYGTYRMKNIRQRRALNATLLSTASDSWTHRSVGLSSQAFVAGAISASRHEQQVLNAFYSGTQAFGVGSIPHTRSLYYSKPRELRKQTYKWVASASMGGFLAASGALIASSATLENPHIFTINVPDSGKIVDVKVWVELVHASASGMHPPLGSFGMALRAPNVSWGHAHPIRNYLDNATSEFFRVTLPNLGRTWAEDVGNPYAVPPNFYRDTYLLWEGIAVFSARSASLSVTYGNDNQPPTSKYQDSGHLYPSWDNDMHMRTVFSDGAGQRHPRDIYDVYVGTYAGVKDKARNREAPCKSFGAALGPQDRPYTDPEGLALGAGAGWIELVGGGSPPPGWLTGGGGAAGTLEWSTTGSNNGPTTMRPIYPIMDDIIVRKLYHTNGQFNLNGVVTPNIRANWSRWVGSRPGLRDKEMQGNWQLLITAGQNRGTLSWPLTYLRQWRLEITYEVLNAQTLRYGLRPKANGPRSSCVPGRRGEYLVGVISGSTGFPNLSASDNAYDYSNYVAAVTPADFYNTGIYVVLGGEIERGRTVGITHDYDEFVYGGSLAVYTGSISASLDVSTTYDMSTIREVLDPTPLLGGARTLGSVINTSDLRQTTSDAMSEAIASLASGSEEV